MRAGHDPAFLIHAHKIIIIYSGWEVFFAYFLSYLLWLSLTEVVIPKVLFSSRFQQKKVILQNVT